MAGYTRQSSAQIAAGQQANLSAPFNNEFNQLAAAFDGTSGHVHDGSTGNGPTLTRSALTSFGANTGIVAVTSSTAFAARTITGTSNEITVTNGNGVSGNPTLSLPTALTFTGKTVTGGTFSGITLASSTVPWSNVTGTPTTVSGYSISDAVTLTGSQTLTNKTLTTPIISSISNTGTLTLPTSTDTLVGRATTDTLTNKTLTSPVISGGSINDATLGNSTPSSVSATLVNVTGSSAPTNGIYLPSGSTLGFSTNSTQRAVIDSSGRLIIGHSTSVTSAAGVAANLQLLGQSTGPAALSVARYTADTGASRVIVAKSRSTSYGSFGILSADDPLGRYQFGGDDGTQILLGAEIVAKVDGTPGTNDMPTRMEFSTTADGASSPTIRMTISNGGTVAIAGAATVGTTLDVTGNVAVNTNKFNVTAASGNTAIAGTLGVTGDVAVNTNKFTVAASSGNTLVAGTLAVTGAATLSSTLDVTGAVTGASFSGSGASLTSLNASNLSSGTVATARLGSGTANSSSYLRGDQTWATLPAGYHAKANFTNMTVSSPTINNGTNFASITRNSTGNYSVTFTNAASNTDYVPVAMVTRAANTDMFASEITSVSTSGFTFRCWSSGGSNFDPDSVRMVVFN